MNISKTFILIHFLYHEMDMKTHFQYPILEKITTLPTSTFPPIYDKAPPAQSETPDKSAPPTPASSTDAGTSSSKTTASHSHAASQHHLTQVTHL